MTAKHPIAFWRVLAHVVILRPLVWILSGPRIRGGGHLRGLGQYVIVANHNSHLDVMLLFHLIPTGDIPRTRAVADEAYFSRNRLIFKLVTFLFDPVWVRRGSATSQNDPLDAVRDCLESGANIIVFPEGTRGDPGSLAPFRSGLGRVIAEHPDIPVVPVFLHGADRALPKSRSLLVPIACSVLVGPPRRWQAPHRQITRELEEAYRSLDRMRSRHSHRRPEYPTRPRIISVMGIDGSGKSTLSQGLAVALSSDRLTAWIGDTIQLLRDGAPLGVKPFITERLRERIAQHAKSAASLRSYKLPKLAEMVLRERLAGTLTHWYHPEVLVGDGSPLLNILGWTALYRPGRLDDGTIYKIIAVMTGRWRLVSRRDPVFRNFPELTLFERQRIAHFSLPDIVIYLSIDPATACDRIEMRGASKQVHESVEKLTRLDRSYDTVITAAAREWNLSVLRLDATESIDALLSRSREFVRQTLAGEANK